MCFLKKEERERKSEGKREEEEEERGALASLLKQILVILALIIYKILKTNCLYHLNGTRNSRVSGHGIRIVLYALVRLVTVVVLLK